MSTDFFGKLFDWRKCKRKFHPGRFVGAGPVNWWPLANHRKETAKLAKAGIPCYHIELFGWADSHGYDKPGKVKQELDRLLFWCRRRRLSLFVSVVNDNIHLSKYGNTPLKLEQYRSAITGLMQHLKKRQKKQIYIQPVGETQTAAGRAIELEAAGIFPQDRLVYNGNGGRPGSRPGWAGYIAHHAARHKDAVPAGAWDVTDHGTRLNEMGGTGAQSYNNDYLEADARKASQRGCPYIMYGFQVRKLDKGNLRAIARGYYS